MGRLQQLEGWAVKWHDVADRGDFMLKLHPDAFDESLSNYDQNGLLHHDMDRPIARRSNGSLTFQKLKEGLYVKIIPNDTTSGHDAVKLAQSGDAGGQSLGFKPLEIDVIPPKKRGDLPTVVVLKATLKEDSIVTRPAMQTSTLKVSEFEPSPQLAELREFLAKRS